MKRSVIAFLIAALLASAVAVPAAFASPSAMFSALRGMPGLTLKAQAVSPELVPGLSFLAIGADTELVVTANESGTWAWESSDPDVVKITLAQNLNVNVEGVSPGTATITGTRQEDGFILSQQITVVQPHIEGPAATLVGTTVQLSVEGAEGATWNWSVKGEGLQAEIDEHTGLLRAGDVPGTLQVKASMEGNDLVYCYFEMRIVQYDFTKVEVGEIELQPYTGQPVTPSFSLKMGDAALQPYDAESGTGDYSVEYRDNVNPGTATAILTGRGDYLGTKTVTFQIYSDFPDKARVKLGDWEWGAGVLPQETWSYQGRPVTLPAEGEKRLAVFYNDEELTPDADYEVSYADNVNAGQATVTVSGRGRFSGDIVRSFIISPASLQSPDREVSVSAVGATYTGAECRPKPTVRWGDATLVEGEDYEIVGYASNVNAGTASVTVKGKGNFQGERSGSFDIARAELKGLTLAQSAFIYDGSYKSPEVNVTGAPGATLQRDTDYRLDMPAGRLLPGSYVYKVTGMGNYTGTLQATMTVVKARIASVSLSQQTYTYDGTAKSPTVNVWSSNGVLLQEGAGYTLATPPGRVNAGTYTYTARPTDTACYEDAPATATLTVKPASISASLPTTKYAYTGSAVKPIPRVTWAGGTVPSSGYSLAYSNNKKLGTATVTVTGKGNFAGSKTFKFTIAATGAKAPGATSAAKAKKASVKYNAHVQNVGWQKYVRDGAKAGAAGKSLRLEGLHVKLRTKPYSGGIRYKTHIQNIGWEKKWKRNGAMSGTSGKSLRLEGVRIQLTGKMAKKYDVYYRVYCQKFGWMGWAKNGAKAGSSGYSRRLEGLQVKLVAKGGKAPGSTKRPFRSK